MRFMKVAGALTVTFALAVACGCARGPAQRPAPAQLSPQQGSIGQSPQQEGSVAYPSPRAGSAYADPSMGVGIIASAVPSAGTVRAVVMGNVALLGFPSTDPVVHRRVAEQVRSSFPNIVEVRITQDPATISRLAQIGEMIRSQRSISPYLSELANLSGAMRSATR